MTKIQSKTENIISCLWTSTQLYSLSTFSTPSAFIKNKKKYRFKKKKKWHDVKMRWLIETKKRTSPPGQKHRLPQTHSCISALKILARTELTWSHTNLRSVLFLQKFKCLFKWKKKSWNLRIHNLKSGVIDQVCIAKGGTWV